MLNDENMYSAMASYNINMRWRIGSSNNLYKTSASISLSKWMTVEFEIEWTKSKTFCPPCVTNCVIIAGIIIIKYQRNNVVIISSIAIGFMWDMHMIWYCNMHSTHLKWLDEHTHFVCCNANNIRWHAVLTDLSLYDSKW